MKNRYLTRTLSVFGFWITLIGVAKVAAAPSESSAVSALIFSLLAIPGVLITRRALKPLRPENLWLLRWFSPVVIIMGLVLILLSFSTAQADPSALVQNIGDGMLVVGVGTFLSGIGFFVLSIRRG